MCKVCHFGYGFGLRVFFSGSVFRDKVFLSLAHVQNPGCVSVTLGSESGSLGLVPGLWITDLLDFSSFSWNI